MYWLKTLFDQGSDNKIKTNIKVPGGVVFYRTALKLNVITNQDQH